MSNPLRTTRVSIGTIALVVFVLVSSGPFGVEEMVSATGPGLTLILLAVIPLTWGAPLALVCAELAAAIPEEGGPYVWVERGLGRFWGFQSGWWSTLSGLVDTTLYPVLAASYANSWLGGPPWLRWLLAVAAIAFFSALNVRSLRSMMLSTSAMAVLVLVPCAAMAMLGLASWRNNPFTPLVPAGQSTAAGLGLGLTVAIWFYSGYESMSTMAGEVAEPERVIPRAVLASLPLVVAAYLLPTVAGLAAVGRWQEWSAESGLTLVKIAGELGGPLLIGPMMLAALASNLALYNAYLASGARTTFVMAERDLLPRPFGSVHPRFGTPHGSILIAATIHAVLAMGSFEVLLVIDVFLFVISYLLMFVAAAVLRVREPDLARPFRVPGGSVGMAAAVGAPTLVGLLLLAANGTSYFLAGAAAAATGPVAYMVLKPRD